ncbi:MAG: hypothetical protein ACRCSP_06480, partial [Rhodoglobus sp.]
DLFPTSSAEPVPSGVAGLVPVLMGWTVEAGWLLQVGPDYPLYGEVELTVSVWEGAHRLAVRVRPFGRQYAVTVADYGTDVAADQQGMEHLVMIASSLENIARYLTHRCGPDIRTSKGLPALPPLHPSGVPAPGWTVTETTLSEESTAAYPDRKFPTIYSDLEFYTRHQATIHTDGWYRVSHTSDEQTSDEQTSHHNTAQPPPVLFRNPTVAADFTHIAELSLEQIHELYVTSAA